MTMRAHIATVESAAGLAGLGRLSDQAALAVLRAKTGPLEPQDRQALEAGRHLLARLLEFSGTALPPTSTLRSMNSFGLMDEALEAAFDQSGVSEDFVEFLRTLVASIDLMLDQGVSDEKADSIFNFFNQLSAVTLVRSTEFARPRRDLQVQWASKAASSFVS